MTNIKGDTLMFRQGSSPGEWLSFLVTLLIYTNCTLEKGICSEPQHRLTLILSTSFIINSIFWANRLIYRQEGSAHSGALYRFIMSPIQGSSDCLTLTNVEIKSEKRDLLMALTLWAFAMKTVGIGEGLLAFFVYFVHSDLLPLLFTTFPGSFTFGEGCLALQSTIVYAMHSIQMLAHFQDNVSTAGGSFIAIGRVCLLSVICMLAFPLVRASSCFKSPTFFFAYGTAFFMAATYPLLWLVLKRNPLLWVLTHILSTATLPSLIALWGAMVAAALATVQAQTSKANTRTRKIFHVLVVVVHVSGAILDPHFTSMASQIVLGVFILLEFIRAHKIEPFASVLNQAFSLFVDDKDRGSLVLTNIYLLVGTFSPLWLAPQRHLVSRHLSIFSGVLSVGIGDAVASVVGSRLGQNRWRGTSKTVEGTVASLAAQLAFVVLWASLIWDASCTLNFGFVVLAIGVSAVMEALTEQVDNVVLPVTLYLMLAFL